MEQHQLVITNIGFAIVICGVVLYILQALLRGAKRALFRTARPETLGAQMVSLFSMMPEPTPVRTARLRTAETDVETAASIKELSAEGAFVIHSAPLPPGETISLRLPFTGHPDLCPEGTVVWNNAGVAEEDVVSRGMRVRFRWPDPKEAARLTRILSELEAGEDDGLPGNRATASADRRPPAATDLWAGLPVLRSEGEGAGSEFRAPMPETDEQESRIFLPLP